MEGIYCGTICVLIDVPEETPLPYESLQDDRTYQTLQNAGKKSLTGSRQVGPRPIAMAVCWQRAGKPPASVTPQVHLRCQEIPLPFEANLWHFLLRKSDVKKAAIY
jgi:hypothetical protein